MTASNKTPKRPQKKTDMLEVRVSPEEKQAFLDACKQVGRSASSVIRDAMRAYANFGPMVRPIGSPIVIVSAFAGAAAGVFALTGILSQDDAMSAEELAAYGRFSDIDIHHDRYLTLEEYQAYFGDFRAAVAGISPGNAARTRRDEVVYGLGVGQLLADQNIDENAFVQQPDRIEPACWSAMEGAYQRFVLSHFNSRDLNNDGLVSFGEYARMQLDEWQAGFRSVDIDGDGVLTVTDVMMDENVNVNGSRPFVPPAEEPAHIALCRASAGAHPGLNNTPQDRVPVSEEMAAFFLTINDYDGNSEVTFSEWVTGFAN